MDITQKINEILAIKESYKAPERMMQILFDKERREETFMKFLNEITRDLSFDVFHEYFEDEHADRKKKKQDFTPECVSELLSKLVGNNANTIYEPTAGTGGLVISKWNDLRIKEGIFKFEPNNYLFVCEDLSDRSIPFLLFNLCIRGMNAVVIHGDVLTRQCYGVFLIQNPTNDYMKFSNLNVLPYTKEVEEYFKVNFVERRYKDHVENDVSLCGIKNE